jgi:sugar (glycoside-pentoside-hexuronide) transporter
VSETDTGLAVNSADDKDNGEAARTEKAAPALSFRVKCAYALGDHTINVQLSAVSLFFLFFLTEVAHLSPSRAGLVLLVGRAVDAFTDPMMGRISDATRWRLGRRRPYFLAGALPFGMTFALLWSDVGTSTESGAFLFYASIFVANTLCSTVLAVPYSALLPELALGYDERTSMNTFRSIAVMAAIMLTALGMPALVTAFGGGGAGYAGAGQVLGVWVALPWLAVFAATWERPDFRAPRTSGIGESLRQLFRHGTYRTLVALFLCGRIAVDVSGAILLFYFTYWLRRGGDFGGGVAIMLVAVIASLPLWLQLARHTDKRNVFIAGALWWAVSLVALFAADASTPRWWVFTLFASAGVGYAVADLIPWAMLGDVIDEAELATGERREGIYSGFFTFVRKLGGAVGVAATGVVLDLAGFERAAAAQPESALSAIRALTTFGPLLFLSLAIAAARHYPLSRDRHAAIATALAQARDDGRRHL